MQTASIFRWLAARSFRAISARGVGLILTRCCLLAGSQNALAFGPAWSDVSPLNGADAPRGAARPSQTVPQATGTVHGVVFDSLAMAPAAQAMVWIPGTSHSTTADSSGRFTLSGIPAGAHFIAFSSPALDSLGLGALGANAMVLANQTTDLNLGTPAFRALARALCGDSASMRTDAGIVWGTVRDAATGIRQSGARANFIWRDVSVGADKQVQSREAVRAAFTDSTATYYACGLPTDVTVLASADGARASSGVLQITIGARRLRRMDWLVSADMVLTEGVSPSTTTAGAALLRPRGLATVRGVVMNEKGVPLPSTVVGLASADTTVHTNITGEFVLGGLPGGTHDLVVRRVGFAPVHMAVDLQGGNVESVTVVLPSTQLLEAINVRADPRTIADRRDYELRRKAGFGYAFDEKAFRNHEDIATVLQGAVPSTSIMRSSQRGVSITMQRISLSGGPMECSPLIWEDGRRSGPAALEYPIEHYRAIEVFPRATSAPPMYVGLNQACGVVLVWTKFARW